MGQLTLAINEDIEFERLDGPKPQNNELFIEHGTDDIGVWKVDENGVAKKINRTKELRIYIESLERSGAFANAEAFINDRKLYRFYFDNTNGTVRLDTERVYPETYKYYAIRKPTISDEGTHQYMTGVYGLDTDNKYSSNNDPVGDGKVLRSTLVNMNRVESESGDGRYVSKPGVGNTIGEFVDGDSYVVEFYDANLKMISYNLYQAIECRASSSDLCPDTGVKDIVVECSQMIDGEIYLYRGQDVSSLDFSISLIYADGRKRNITHETGASGRLAINGLDEIDNSVVTEIGDTPQTIEVSYVLHRTRESFKQMNIYTTENGAVVDPNTSTMLKSINVIIKDDPYDTIEEIIPAGYGYKDNEGNTSVNMKYFARYTNKGIFDISSITRYTEGRALVISGADAFGKKQNISIEVPYGNANEFRTEHFTFTAIAPGTNDIASRLIFGSTEDNVIEVRYDNSANAGGAYTGKLVGINYTSRPDNNIETFLSGITVNGVSPDRIRIRDVMDPNYIYTDVVDFEDGIYYLINGDHNLFLNKPLLIEFYKTTIDPATGYVKAVDLLTAKLAYAKPTSVS